MTREEAEHEMTPPHMISAQTGCKPMLGMLKSSWASPEPDAPPTESSSVQDVCSQGLGGVSRGIHCKYCIAQTIVNNPVGKSFVALAGPFVTVFCFLESHKRNSALSKVNSKILVSRGVGEWKEG